MDEAAVRELAGSVMGSPVEAIQRVSSGASRATFIVTLDDGRMVVARVDTGDGPTAGTELTLAREATMYRALAGTDVQIPRSYGVSEDGRVLMLERADGAPDYLTVAQADKHAIYDTYIDALATLHNVDASSLDLPGFARPSSATDHAVMEIDVWERIFDARTTKPWPLARFAFHVLRRLAPSAVARTVACHGDVGPGNFLHDGSRLTAMLDWEFSHLGDPMDDLGWWLFRGHDMAGDCGDLAAELARWSAATGIEVQPASIAYYPAFVMLRWYVSVVATVDTGGAGMDRSIHHMLIPTLGVLLPRALAEITGHELEPAPAAPDEAEPLAADVAATVMGDVTSVLMPAATDPESKRRLGGMLAYVSHLSTVDRLGPSVRDRLLREATTLLGGAPTSLAEADQQVAASVATLDEQQLLTYFWRTGHARAALWPIVGPRVAQPLTQLPG